MFALGDGITDDLEINKIIGCEKDETNVIEEDLENYAGFFINEAADTLHSTTSSQSSDGRFGNA